MEEVAQGQQADNAEVPAGASSVSVHGSAGTSVSLAAPSLGSATLNTRIRPVCTNHSLSTYYATDHLGTVRFTKTVDENGNEVATTTHDYEPFGVEIPTSTPDTCDNTHRFTGHERDLETGNDYMHYRFYAAGMGRFMKPDNITGSALNPQAWNLYSYVRGNPVNFNDPLGHARPGPGTGRQSQMEMVGGGFFDSTLGQNIVLSDYEAYQQMMNPNGLNMGLGAAMVFSGVAGSMTTSESSATLQKRGQGLNLEFQKKGAPISRPLSAAERHGLPASVEAMKEFLGAGLAGRYGQSGGKPPQSKIPG